MFTENEILKRLVSSKKYLMIDFSLKPTSNGEVIFDTGEQENNNAYVMNVKYMYPSINGMETVWILVFFNDIVSEEFCDSCEPFMYDVCEFINNKSISQINADKNHKDKFKKLTKYIEKYAFHTSNVNNGCVLYAMLIENRLNKNSK